MSALGVISGLAQGYAKAADKAREDAFLTEQQQRQDALGLGKLLLNNPEVPPEYKPLLVDYMNEAIHGKKPPDFHKMVMSQAPAVRAPAVQPQPVDPNAGRVPPITLAPPTPPPGMEGAPANGVPIPAVPRGMIGPSQGPGTPGYAPTSAGAPPQLPPGAGAAQIPGRGITPPSPPPAQELIPAGQFGMLTPAQKQDLALRQQMNQMTAMRGQFPGRSNEDIYTAMQKGQFPTHADKKIQSYVSEDGKQHVIYETPDGTRYDEAYGGVRASAAMLPKLAFTRDAQGNIVSVMRDPKTNKIIPGTENPDILPPSGYLQNIRQGYYTFTDADGNVTQVPVTTISGKVLPSGKGAAPSGTATPTAGATAKGGKTAGAAPAPAQPPTQDVGARAFQQPKGTRIVGNKGPTGQTKSRADQAAVIIPAGDDLIGNINANRDVFGNMNSYWNQFVNNTPISDPKAAGLVAQIASFAALQPALHGFRSTNALKEFEKIIGGIPKNPESLINSIKSIQQTAGRVYEAGYHKPFQSAVSGPSTPPGGTGAARPPLSSFEKK